MFVVEMFLHRGSPAFVALWERRSVAALEVEAGGWVGADGRAYGWGGADVVVVVVVAVVVVVVEVHCGVVCSPSSFSSCLFVSLSLSARDRSAISRRESRWAVDETGSTFFRFLAIRD